MALLSAVVGGAREDRSDRMTIKAPRAPLQLTTIEDELDDVLAAACDRESLVLIELVMSRLDARGRCLSLPKMNSMRPARRVPRHAAARFSAYLLKPRQQQNMQNRAEIYT